MSERLDSQGRLILNNGSDGYIREAESDDRVEKVVMRFAGSREQRFYEMIGAISSPEFRRTNLPQSLLLPEIIYDFEIPDDFSPNRNINCTALVLEKMDGDMSDFHSESNPISVATNINIDDLSKMLLAAAEGIDFMHNYNVTHSDLKAKAILHKKLENGETKFQLADFSAIRIPNESEGQFFNKAPDQKGFITLIYEVLMANTKPAQPNTGWKADWELFAEYYGKDLDELLDGLSSNQNLKQTFVEISQEIIRLLQSEHK